MPTQPSNFKNSSAAAENKKTPLSARFHIRCEEFRRLTSGENWLEASFC